MAPPPELPLGAVPTATGRFVALEALWKDIVTYPTAREYVTTAISKKRLNNLTVVR
jgi:hypothetical protein